MSQAAGLLESGIADAKGAAVPGAQPSPPEQAVGGFQCVR
jgi:hypothetical protein